MPRICPVVSKIKTLPQLAFVMMQAASHTLASNSRLTICLADIDLETNLSAITISYEYLSQ
jgi:hypothetical protein